MSSSLLLKHDFFRLSWMIHEMGVEWPYSSCFVECCLHRLFKTSCSILVFFPFSFFSMGLFTVLEVQLYSHTWKATSVCVCSSVSSPYNGENILMNIFNIISFLVDSLYPTLYINFKRHDINITDQTSRNKPGLINPSLDWQSCAHTDTHTHTHTHIYIYTYIYIYMCVCVCVFVCVCKWVREKMYKKQTMSSEDDFINCVNYLPKF